MRIAVNTRFLLPGRLEGLGWYTHELLSRVVKAHPEHEFLFLFDRAFDPAFVYAGNVTPRVLFPPARHPVLFYAWFEYAVPRALKEWKADVFFSPDNFLSLSSPVPTLLSVHDMIPLQMPEQVRWIHRIYYNRYLKRFVERADGILTISEYVKKSITEVCGTDPAKIRVAYNGCRKQFVPLDSSAQKATRAQFSGGKPYFFYTGAIHPRKNIHRLIQAYNAFRDRTGADIQLLLAGRVAWERGELTEAYEQSVYKADIHFLGYVPDADLPRIMASAFALVYPSISEGFGLPVLEAMECDIPVITSNTTALPEVAGDAALMIDPLQVPALTAAMEQLWASPQLRNTLIERGRAQRGLFSWDIAANILMEELLLLGGGR